MKLFEELSRERLQENVAFAKQYLKYDDKLSFDEVANYERLVEVHSRAAYLKNAIFYAAACGYTDFRCEYLYPFEQQALLESGLDIVTLNDQYVILWD